jgi:glycosyltransferase involved in cell wall biosynthesis
MLVSIIITSYNYGRFLNEAIDSALNQTYPHTEVVVVDDGSTDNSAEIISGYGERIVPLLRKHEGARLAYNEAFRSSRGEVVIFLDSDDALLPTALERAVKFFEDPDVVKVHWPLWEVDKHSKKIGRVIPEETLSEGNLLDVVIREGPESCASPPMSGNAWSRALLDKILPIEKDGDFHFDTYFSVVAAALGTIRAIQEPQGYYRIHGSNIFASHSSDVRNRKNLSNYEFSCLALSRRLLEVGVQVDPNVWKNDNYHYSWMHMQDAASEELKARIPAGETFILVDEDNWGDGWGRSEVVSDRRSVPFLERDGLYWGPPPDDETAIKEFERLRQTGANFIVFAWPAFWWLDYYSGLARHLRSQFSCVLENERAIVFDLRA